MTRVLLALILGFGAGVVAQYFLDAALIRSSFHAQPWSLYRNVTNEAKFRQEIIHNLMH